MTELIDVVSGPALEEIRELFLEYGQSLNFNLCFQSFDKELRDLPGEYARPAGRLVLCRVDGKAAGCIAFKRVAPDICEMKRLYVRSGFRGQQIGKRLVEHLMAEARNAGYTSMRLDTIPGAMDHAVKLYRELGFHEISSYYENPVSGALFMQAKLRQ